MVRNAEIRFGWYVGWFVVVRIEIQWQSVRNFVGVASVVAEHEVIVSDGDDETFEGAEEEGFAFVAFGGVGDDAARADSAPAEVFVFCGFVDLEGGFHGSN